jgi:cellobiose phosphorylase
MYQLLMETLLGVHLEVDRLRLTPCLPKGWNSYKVHYRYRHTVYHITISRLETDSGGTSRLFLDGQELTTKTVPLADDHGDHSVELKV